MPADHPVYNQQFKKSNWKRQFKVEGLSNGVRELMVLIPSADPGALWQSGAFGGAEREPLAQFMANLFLYSVDKKNLKVLLKKA